jgi:hypothetical protein
VRIQKDSVSRVVSSSAFSLMKSCLSLARFKNGLHYTEIFDENFENPNLLISRTWPLIFFSNIFVKIRIIFAFIAVEFTVKSCLWHLCNGTFQTKHLGVFETVLACETEPNDN